MALTCAEALLLALHMQAMVPLWDALNHVTGRCNVRLHHDEEDECLQMIATGQAQHTLCHRLDVRVLTGFCVWLCREVCVALLAALS